jgi:hypothetical protein
MPLFPKISSPCPYKSDLAAVMDGDHCRMCARQVFDLTAMTDGERLTFLASCTDEVCVSYSIPLRRAAQAAMVAAAIAAPGAAVARPAPPAPPPPMAMIAGGLPPAPQVQMVPMPPVVDREEDVSRLYEEPAKTAPPAAKPPPKG